MLIGESHYQTDCFDLQAKSCARFNIHIRHRHHQSQPDVISKRMNRLDKPQRLQRPANGLPRIDQQTSHSSRAALQGRLAYKSTSLPSHFVPLLFRQSSSSTSNKTIELSKVSTNTDIYLSFPAIPLTIADCPPPSTVPGRGYLITPPTMLESRKLTCPRLPSYQPISKTTKNSKMQTAKDAMNYVSDKVGEATNTASKEANKDAAKDSSNSLSDRASAATGAVGDKASELKDGASAEAHKQKAQH
ncbi:hypothetical protein PSTT_04909 [Puccinia striiformis]|uniref:Glucose-repressible protein n=1 Tax=Puccinia striiformis TaxID=27350 RepID=A0A2S4VQY4_9BASI|nr:hypothetical protein PSTT_04909 [Puccinia striiformis]